MTRSTAARSLVAAADPPLLDALGGGAAPQGGAVAEGGSSRGLPQAPVPDASHPVTDDTLARYASAVREALARRGYALP